MRRRNLAFRQHAHEGLDDVAFRHELADESGVTPTWDVPGFTDVYAQARHSINQVRSCAWLPHRDDVRGFVFDVQTAQLDEVTDFPIRRGVLHRAALELA